jgi:Uma2 family endonuclease
MSISKPLSTDRTPCLEPGDRLSRDEFERRYAAMPHVKKAELIEGVVYVPSAVRLDNHAAPHSHFIGWMWYYKAYTPGVIVADNATVRLDLDNEPQPDASLLLDPRCGGQAIIGADDYVEGAPELVAEVSGSTASFDLHTKKTVYRRNGVREYLVWRVLDREIDWFAASGSDFVLLMPDGSGILRSEVFPGLWLDVVALLRGDLAAVLAVLQRGLASPEHAAFLQTLAQAGGGSEIL